MTYVIDLLNNKKEEYETLLSLVNSQFEKGNVFRSEFEVDSAKKSKSHYEQILADINEKLQLITMKG
ncbi:hypothetical protein GCM10023310_69900 [Paenibacillus vulneris]|uniref:Uncharacterized protein n=1 Tax=Paenibacillus vulneris TaxID=1133364 RepID=A0ABW3UF51_9BACL